MAKTIKCHNCGTYNVDLEYCSQCNVLIDFAKRRQLEQKEAENQRSEKEQLETKKITEVIDKYRNHRYFLVRLLAGISYYTWAAVMAIGAFIAWLISMIAA